MLNHRTSRLVRLNRLAELDPFRSWPLVPLQWRSELAAQGGNATDPSQDGSFTTWSPPVDIVVNDESYSLFVELPGTKREDVNLALHEKVLTVKGEKKPADVGEADKQHRSERRYGTFERSFRLPADAEGDEMRATHRDGVLTIEIPRVKPSKPRHVEIEA